MNKWELICLNDAAVLVHEHGLYFPVSTGLSGLKVYMVEMPSGNRMRFINRPELLALIEEKKSERTL